MNKYFLIQILADMENVYQMSWDRKLHFVKRLKNELEIMEGDKIELHSHSEIKCEIVTVVNKSIFKTVLLDAKNSLPYNEHGRKSVERIISALEKIDGEQVDLMPSLLAFIKWRQEDIEGVFQNVGVDFTEDRYRMILPELKSILEDISEKFDQMEDLVRKTFHS